EKRAPQNRLWSARRCAYLRIPPPAESLFQSFYESGDGGGVVSGKRGDGFLVGRFLGIVAFGEQAGDLVGGEAGARQLGTDLALSFGTVAHGALGFESGRAILREGRHDQRHGQCYDKKQDEQFGNSHSV